MLLPSPGELAGLALFPFALLFKTVDTGDATGVGRPGVRMTGLRQCYGLSFSSE